MATRIAYDYEGAAEQVSVGATAIKEAASRGELERRYMESKPLIGHEALLAWFEGLPTSPPPPRTSRRK